ncbi:MAG: tRNA (adenosine(37)-N6)-threonylcarbamoyltransferase complex ATPase subunit type 1 TsaE [Desulfobacterales bacterium]|nr:tRNA (adenosine(37)-N6)-threonylcarbamoyltransferase complex ATPase subunit type 1 TsaE [Desulfobacterales bacterium]
MITYRLEIISRGDGETRTLGRKIGALAPHGLIVALTGDLGSGKTCLVQGLARGLGVPEEYIVTSPSYTLINEYPGRLPLYHADLYRIENPVDFDDIGLYDIVAGSGVTAIEWADRMQPEDLVEYLSIAFEILDDSLRKIILTASGHPAVNLLKKLENI